MKVACRECHECHIKVTYDSSHIYCLVPVFLIEMKSFFGDKTEKSLTILRGEIRTLSKKREAFLKKGFILYWNESLWNSIISNTCLYLL